jgi:endogenous inhibitor of DNA gyrase (YacG/DUF329 family)
MSQCIVCGEESILKDEKLNVSVCSKNCQYQYHGCVLPTIFLKGGTDYLYINLEGKRRGVMELPPINVQKEEKEEMVREKELNRVLPTTKRSYTRETSQQQQQQYQQQQQQQRQRQRQRQQLLQSKGSKEQEEKGEMKQIIPNRRRFHFYNLRDKENETLLNDFEIKNTRGTDWLKRFPLCTGNVNPGYIYELLANKTIPIHVIYDEKDKKSLGFVSTKNENDKEKYLTIDEICAKRGIVKILLHHIENLAIVKNKEYLKLEAGDKKEVVDFYITNGFFIDEYFKTVKDGKNVELLDATEDVYSITTRDDVIGEIIENDNKIFRAKVYALKETYGEEEWELDKPEYNEEEKKKINQRFEEKQNKYIGREVNPDYDADKYIYMGSKYREYLRDNNYKRNLSFRMIKPLKNTNFKINGKNVIFTAKDDKQLLDELETRSASSSIDCRICGSIAKVIDSSLKIPFCNNICQKMFYY